MTAGVPEAASVSVITEFEVEAATPADEQTWSKVGLSKINKSKAPVLYLTALLP